MVAAFDQMRWTWAKNLWKCSFGCTSSTQTPHKAAAPTSKRAHTDQLPLRVSFKLPLFSTVESRKIPQTSKRETEKAILPYLNWAPILIMILHIGTWEGSRSCRAAGRETRLPCSTLRRWCRLISAPDMSLARDLRWPNVLFTSCS